MAMLSKAYKPDNFELHNPLKICFTNIWGLRLNFDNCESFFVSNSPVILAPCETNLDDSINSGNFSVRGYRPLIRKDFSTHGLVSQFMWRKDFLLHGTYLKKTLKTYLCFWLVLLHSVSYFFFLYQSPSLSLRTVFDSISSNIYEVLSINPSANAFVFGDFNVHHNDRLTYSGGTGRSG